MFTGIKKAFSNLKEKVLTKELNEKSIEENLWEFELKLIENNVSEEVAEKISKEIKQRLLNKKVSRFSKKEKIIEDIYKEILENIFEEVKSFNLIEKIIEKKEKPYVILFLGVNGTGKTTSIAKLAYLLKKQKISCILSCSDTFRAGAIEQLEKHAKILGVNFIKHKYGASPTAVAYDSVQFALKRNIDVVLIDTAGRMQTDLNLIEEMKKLVRVIEPDAKLLVIDSLTGNDAYKQAEIFNKEINLTGYVLTKVDADEKGGISLTIIYSTKKPILFISYGSNYENFMVANKNWIINNIIK